MTRKTMFLALGLAFCGGPLAAQDRAAQRTDSFPHVLEVVGKAANQPMPEGLSRAEQRTWAEQTEWLKSVRDRLEAFGIQAGMVTPREPATGQATGRRQHGPPPRVYKDFGQLRQEVETESRRFTTLSNIMKTRHDVAMNAIRNMKA